MQEQDFKHADGRTATAATATEAVTLRAMGFAPTVAQDEAPSEEWSHARLDEYAVAHGIDLAGAKTKVDKVAAIESPVVADDNA